MTIQEINSLKCTRGWPLATRQYMFIALNALKDSGCALVVNKRNYVKRFAEVCREKSIGVEVYVRPYMGLSPSDIETHYSYAYFFNKAKGESFIEERAKRLDLHNIQI